MHKYVWCVCVKQQEYLIYSRLAKSDGNAVNCGMRLLTNNSNFGGLSLLRLDDPLALVNTQRSSAAPSNGSLKPPAQQL